ncbi:glycosyl hydrolase [Fontisphaera persica]|uniref:glycoside hydrolase family 26 protein n=1 Tax=Fontisphaera persica TaxID=2974023 RepID=UPI0024C0CC80|nr:glycosyl hydrolase [Fontisphaera persica]WCJ59833.1 glycosyl hydrolase [Fontisphaera persica]
MPITQMQFHPQKTRRRFTPATGRVLPVFACFMLLVMVLPSQAQNRQQILQYFKGLGHGSYLFGQMGTWVHGENPNMEHPSNWLKKVQQHTGILPAFGCLTYDLDDNPFTDAQWNEGVKQMWDRGLLVGVYTFWANPCGGRWNEPVQIAPIFAAGTNPVKTHFYRQMDRMAANLLWLKKQGITVIYTPLVESDDRNKWHAKEGPARAIQLYRLIHDYLTAKGVNNVLWAYHTTQRNGALQEYYPGDAYVDILGKSAYGRGLVFDEYDWAVEKKRKAGKVIWWAELGIRGKNEPPRDCLDVLKQLETKYPELAGFNFWSDEGFYNVVGNLNGRELMQDPRIITLNSPKMLKRRP